MEPVYLFSLVNQQKSWLSARQALVAQNVANANTPGYKAADVLPFSRVLDQSAVELTTSNPMHIRTSATDSRRASSKEGDAWEISLSGNSVNLEQEMMKSGEIREAFSLDTSVMKAFHAMWLATLKG